MYRFAISNISRLVEVELLFELVYASTCINKLLFAGEEGVALRANINLNIVLNRLGDIFCAASTLNSDGLVVGMETLLHFSFPLFRMFKEQACSIISQSRV